jgi:hypothetical protein
MAETWFTPKEWKARLVEFAGRRLLRNVANGESTTYDVSRSEGQVSQEGDAFNTKNMNDLEQRIANGFADAKTAVDTLSKDLQNKMSKYYGSVTLSEANEKAVLKHLLVDVDLIGKYGNCDFSVLVNSAQFYSGTMYSDGGVTAWGNIQQRNSGNAPGSLYSFYYNRGADPVLKKLGRSGTIAGVGGYWIDPPAGQNEAWTTGCVRWNGDDLVVTVEDDYAQGHLTVGAKVGSKSRPSQWGDKTGGLITLKY